ncbi:MAG: SLBB domain-containing protein [Prevotella sp.]|nr:SLBB domain-containing protein [Prevotella sp.]
MKKYLLLFALIWFSGQSVFAQSSMSDQQLIDFIVEEKDKGSSQSDIVTKLMQRGVDIQQIQRVKRMYDKQIKQAGLSGAADKAAASAEKRMRKNNGQMRSDAASQQISSARGGSEETDFELMQDALGDMLPVDSIAMLNKILEEQRSDKNKIYGHDLFNNKILSFEPNMNIATPKDYVLGPGDAVIIDIYGASQETMTATIAPDGFVTIEGFGPVMLSGLTEQKANARLRSLLGARYSSSQIRLTVGQTRTISVNIAGEVVTPGTYTLSAFATVFNALYMAGGITKLGTVRNIKVYRNNRHISTVDVYDYIVNGKATGNIRLTDNDMIIVEAYESLVNITGRVKRPMYYEMKKDESLQSLLKYAGGFAGDAYRNSVRVIRENGALHSVHTVTEFDFGTFHLVDGDSVSVDQNIRRFSNRVEVKGAVFRPGMYEIGGNLTTVRSLLEAAQGVKEDAITQHAVLHRMKPDRTLEVLSVDIAGILEGRVSDVPLQNEDALFVASKEAIQEAQTLTIHGEVQYPGVYKYADNETIEDFILQAGGLTDAASTAKVDISRRIINPNATSEQDSISQLFTFSLKDGFVVEPDKQAFHLEPYDEVFVRRSPGFSDHETVRVEGEVLYPGVYTLSRKNERLSEVISRSGGLKKSAYTPGARLIRELTSEEKARQLSLIEAARRSSNGRDSIDISTLNLSPNYPVGIELDKALEKPGCDADIVLRPGDRIVVPEYTNTVKINGEVMYPNTVSFKEGKSLDYYINLAGGWSDNAKKRKTYIIYMNGTVAKAKKSKPAPGCEIVVPTKQRRNKLTTGEMLAIGTSTASIATMVATIFNVLK